MLRQGKNGEQSSLPMPSLFSILASQSSDEYFQTRQKITMLVKHVDGEVMIDFGTVELIVLLYPRGGS